MPRFMNEAAEARWVFRNQGSLGEAFESECGPRLTVDGIVARSRTDAGRTGVLVDLSPGGLDLARRLARSAKMEHRDYLKRLLRRAIRGESQRLRKQA